MIPDSLKKFRPAPAAEIAGDIEPGDEARALLAGHPDGPGFLAALMAHRLWIDAVRVLAFALPNREGVWWACLAARATLPADRPPGMEAAIAAAEAWVYHPEEANRRAAFPPAEALGFQTPAGYAALAAFWSGGSLAPPDMPEVPPSPKLCPTAVAAAVLAAAVLSEPAKAEDKYRAALAAGLDIAAGGNGKPGKSWS